MTGSSGESKGEHMGWRDSETLRIAELDPAGEPKGTVRGKGGGTVGGAGVPTGPGGSPRR